MKHDEWRWRPRPHRRPIWWPDRETWPPADSSERFRRWRRPGRGFLWRIGVLFILVWILVATICGATVWLAGILAGSQSPSPALWIPLAAAYILLSGLLSVLRRLALPLRDLIDAAQRVESGDLTPRVSERGPRELRALSRAFNGMLGHLQRNEEARRRLLADVTHELRTPVAVLHGNLEALLDGVYPADAEHLSPLLEETRVLSRLIDDLRTLSLAESGALELHREPTDLDVLIDEVLASFRADADAAGVAIHAEAAGEMPLVEVDPLRLREVLVNLMGNALRHTPRGGEVRIAASVEAGALRLSVADTGKGIAADDLPHIFERFYKSPDSKGSGLGLPIARNLEQAHGGEITAESALGAGTTMRFRIPLWADSRPWPGDHDGRGARRCTGPQRVTRIR